MFDIIDILKAGAEERDWHFAIGNSEYLNYEFSPLRFLPGQKCLGVDFVKMTPEIFMSKLVINTFEGFLMLGQKIDCDGTVCDLTETQLQKYERRGKDLIQLAAITIPTLLCDTGWEIKRFDIEPKINSFDSGIDFVIIDLQVTK